MLNVSHFITFSRVTRILGVSFSIEQIRCPWLPQSTSEKATAPAHAEGLSPALILLRRVSQALQ